MGHYTASMKRVRGIARKMEGKMGWTSTTPTKAGVYWYLENGQAPQVCHVEEIFRNCWWATFFDDAEGDHLDKLHGEWHTLSPPEP